MSRSPAVILYDASGNPMAVLDGVAIPASTPAMLIAGKEPASGNAKYVRVGTDGTVRVDTDGSQKFIVRGGAKGTTVAADVTSTAEGADHQALDVQIMHSGAAKDPTQIRSLTSSDSVTAVQGTAAALAAAWPVKVTDGSNVLGVTANPVVSSGKDTPSDAFANPTDSQASASLGMYWDTVSGKWVRWKGVVRGGAKGTTAAADVTSESVDANRQPLHVKVIGGSGSGNPGNNVRIVDDNALPLDGLEDTAPSSPNGLMMAGWEEAANRLHKISVDPQGRLYVITAGRLGDMVNLFYRNTEGAIVASQFKRILTYTVPAGYSAYLVRLTTWQNESAYSRVAAEKQMGTLSVPTNTFTDGSAYGSTQFAGTLEAEVTTAFGSANNVTVTATYTNQNGVGSRTGTFAIAKSSIVGTRVVMALQAGDFGVRSIQGLSASPSGGAGVIKLLGFIQFAWHFDLSTTQGVNSDFAPGAVAFPTGTVLAIEFSGGTVAKERIINALIQLVTA